MGYLKPVYSKFDLGAGRWRNGYREKEFFKIMQGYACGNCGEDYEGVYREVCPVCLKPNEGGTTDVPPEWR